jgi:hypothetical protein
VPQVPPRGVPRSAHPGAGAGAAPRVPPSAADLLPQSADTGAGGEVHQAPQEGVPRGAVSGPAKSAEKGRMQFLSKSLF